MQLRDSVPVIRDMLQSARSNDEVSVELLDFVGYDNIELVTELCSRRAEAAALVRTFLPLVVVVSNNTCSTVERVPERTSCRTFVGRIRHSALRIYV